VLLIELAVGEDTDPNNAEPFFGFRE